MLGKNSVKEAIIWFALLTPLALYGATILPRPGREPIASQPLFKGIDYSRQIKDQARPQVIHIVDIDLTAPGIKPYVSSGYAGVDLSQPAPEREEAAAQRTSEFITAEGLQLAVNANFFYEFREATPWSYRPRTGQTANIIGLAISDGEVVSPMNKYRTALCFKEQRAVMQWYGECPEGTQQAVAGNLMLLENGQPTDDVEKWVGYEGHKPYPVTIAALDATGTRLWLVVVDGKQPFYSEGITLTEITALVESLGADTAVRLDGGGSATVAIATPSGPQMLNVPIHAKVPGWERPVANHLGFFAQPLDP
ncbi:MAG: phosphodiester glycosidase family protein [Cyanobacteria bacterium P01_F01_bin.13]